MITIEGSRPLTWQQHGVTWRGSVEGQEDVLLLSPDEVLAWVQRASRLFGIDATLLSDPTLTGDRGRAIKSVASQGLDVVLVVGAHEIRATATTEG